MTRFLPASNQDIELPRRYRIIAPEVASDGVRKVGGVAPGALALLTREAMGSAGVRSAMVVTHSDREAERVCQELRFYLGDAGVAVDFIADTETLPYDEESPHGGLMARRGRALHALMRREGGGETVVVASVETLMRRVAPPAHWVDDALELKVGASEGAETIAAALERIGYRRAVLCEALGSYALRPGGVLDIGVLGSEEGVRVRFEAGRIAALEALSLSNQRSRGAIAAEAVEILPAREAPSDADAIRSFRQNWRKRFERSTGDPVYDAVSAGLWPGGVEYYLPLFCDPVSLLDFVGETTPLVVGEGVLERAAEHWALIERRHREAAELAQRQVPVPELIWDAPETIAQRLGEHRALLAQSPGEAFGTETHGLNRAHTLAEVRAGLARILEEADKALFVVRTDIREQHVTTICHMLGTNPVPVASWAEFEAMEAGVAITRGRIERGFAGDAGEVVISEIEVFGEAILQKNPERMEEGLTDEQEQELLGLRDGDPLVHIQQGVGRFAGIEAIGLQGVDEDYLGIRYANETRLFTAMKDLDLVMPYRGVDSANAPFDNPRGKRWMRGVSQAQKEIRRVAGKLIEIEERRRRIQGVAMERPGSDYERFVSEFPFEDTRDQRRASEDIVRDLCADTPMDRVVCGDVGFGKTEVAMRAAYLAVASGYQVAVLVPTTLLAAQHFETFQRRFARTSVRIECLSRFSERAEERASLRRLAAGDVDIMIGTHRLLQKDVRFPNLGLMIIDEEHRFGVAQKDRIRRLRAKCNGLSLTATPIPRTLALAMHGIRELSIIATPPAKRLSIRTTRRRFDARVVREACERELQRDGQVFFVHNRIESIEAVYEELREILPEGVRIEYAHARMGESELESVMTRFYRHEFDVLVCTTIIETGIDIPNANTILIDRAEHFGLAQLHQLRGRVGRSHHQAYAYLLTRGAIGETARHRLDALCSANKLGQGLMLATRDLEIRGAGELLGDEQSGKIQAIGYPLYMRLLERTLEALRAGEEVDAEWVISSAVDVQVEQAGSLPASHIDEPGLRLAFYKRLASAESPEEVEAIAEELIDRFGPLPPPGEDLIALSRLRAALRHIGASRGLYIGDEGYIDLRTMVRVSLSKLIALTTRQPGHYALDDTGHRLYCRYGPRKPEERLALLEDLARGLAKEAS